MVEDLTSRAEMDQFLLESVIDTMPIFLYWKDVNLIYIGCNKHYATINGFEITSDIIGKIDENLPWANYRLEEIQRSDQRVMKNNVPEYNIIESWILPNGNEVIYNTNRIPIRNSNGNVIGILTTYEDITVKDSLERYLMKSEEKYRNMINHLDIGYYNVGMDGIILDHNRTFNNLVSADPSEDLTGLSAPDFWQIPADREKYLKELMNNGFVKNHIVPVLKRNGEKFIVQVNAHLIRNDDGKPISIEGTFAEITERFQLEKKLQESEDRLKSFMDSATDSFTLFDANFNYVDLNKKSMTMANVGLNKEEIIGKNILDIIPNLKETGRYDKYLEVVKTGKPFFIDDLIPHPRFGDIHLSVSAFKVGDGLGIITTDITESKKAEHKLRESEKRYRDFLENLNDLAYETDKIGNVTYLNKIGEELIGLPRDKILEHNFLPLFSEEDGKIAVENYTKTLNGGSPTFELTFITSGKTCHYSNKPLKNDNGEIIGVFGIARDITERKKAEQKLKESEAKYRHLFNSTPYAIWLVDLKGKIIDCNNTMNKFMSIFKREDLIGKPFREVIKMFISKGDPRFENLEHTFRERFILLLKQGYLEPIEFEISRGDGKTFWITLETSFVKVGKESLIQAFIKDITERKEAELKIKKSEEDLRVLNKELEIKVQERTRELRQSEIKFRTIFESIPDLFFLVSDDSTIVDYRGKEEDLYMSPQEFLGKKLKNIMLPDIGKETQKMINETIDTRKPQIMEYNSQIKDKMQFFEARFLFFSEKRVAIFVRNITDRKVAEIELNKSREKLRQQNIELIRLDNAKDDFISMAAHELKTPLISISGYTDYILTKHKDDLSIAIKGDLEIVQRNIARLQRIINQLLEVIKLESLKIDLSIKRTNISEIIYKCLHELGYLFKEKDHEMVLNVDNEIFLDIDHERIFQVFSNLISNAVKFTPKGGRIEISAKKEENRYLFEVMDNGIGLSKDQLPRLFQKFERAHQESEEDIQTGTGLGLYISKGFVRAHGGEIWAISQGKNKGMTISFTIPY